MSTITLKPNLELGVVPTHIKFVGGLVPDANGKLPRGEDGRLLSVAELARLRQVSPVKITSAQVPVFPGMDPTDVEDLFGGIKAIGMKPHMIMMVAGSEVPKFTVIVNGSYGAGNYGMAGRAFDPRLLFMWPQAQISVMGAEQAAGVLTDVKIRQLQREGRTLSQAEIDAIRAPVIDDYRRESSAWYATSELWDDGVLDPLDTRNALGIGLSAAMNAPIGTPGYGVLRL